MFSQKHSYFKLKKNIIDAMLGSDQESLSLRHKLMAHDATHKCSDTSVTLVTLV